MSNFTIQVKDYQSILKAEIVVEDGLNVIVGKTNAGKSAVLRAIDDALFNKGNDDMVKTGKRYAGVSIDNGRDKFVWRRDSHGKNEKTMYQINENNPLVKVGRVQLEEIAKLFNITDVRLSNGVKEKINFWYQGAPPFLTDKTSGQLFEFLSQSSCDKYIKVVKKMESDMKSQKSRLEGINGSIDVLKNINSEKLDYLEKNNGFSNLYTMIVVMNEEVSKFNKIEELFERHNSLKAKIYIKTKSLETICKELRRFNFEEVQSLYNEIVESHRYIERVGEYLDSIETKKKTKSFVGIRLKHATEEFDNKSVLVNECKESIDEIDTLNSWTTSVFTILKDIKEKKEKKRVSKESFDGIVLSMDRIDTCTLAESVTGLEVEDGKVKEVRELVDSYNRMSSKRNAKEGELGSLNGLYNLAFKEFEEFKSTIGACPYCNNALGGEHVC